jgi:hypothetical protein
MLTTSRLDQMTTGAVKFIRELAEKRHKQQNATKRRGHPSVSSSKQKFIEKMMDARNKTVFAEDGSDSDRRRGGLDSLHLDPDQDAYYGLPDYCSLRHRFLVTIIKPQVVLHSEAEEDSTVILTAFHVGFKVFNVIDDRYSDDPINNSILHRSFGALDGLQAFYPQDSNSSFIPLEFLVDLRLEPWGFDRVVPRTTAKLRLDEFNRLRIDKGGSSDEGGDEHFRSATDRIVVDCESFSASANPQHYAAIYNVITDLLLYTDPEQRSRSERRQNILLVHDWNDLADLAGKVQDFQNRIRARESVVHAFQRQLDDLDGEARVQLYHLKAEIVTLANELGLLVECITMAGDKKREQQSSGVQVDASARQIAWHMLDAEGSPIAKLAVLGVAFSWLSKKDSTVSNRLAIEDLQALNSSPEHVFSEIIAKSRGLADHQMVKRDMFMTVLWNALSPVGGISIIDHLELHLHPVRLQIEQAVGRKIMDYVFSQRRGNRIRNGDSEGEQRHIGGGGGGSSTTSMSKFRVRGNARRHDPDSSDEEEDSQSISISIASNNRNGKSPVSPSSSVGGRFGDVLPVEKDEDRLDVLEMRHRAKSNRTFVLVDVSPTTLSLSYKYE